MDQVYHTPALLKETIEAMNIVPGGIYADATFGGGGHSRAILAALGPQGRLLGFDRDIDALANAPEDARFTFVHSNFRYMENFMHFYGVEKFDGILADLGVSFHHFDDADRGFSFRAEAPLDMRMNRAGGKTAAEVVNTYDPAQLEKILKVYGDLRNARQFAAAIAAARAQAPVATTTALAQAVAKVIDPRKEKKELAQVFQALRMEVNGEVDALSRFLEATPRMLRPGGRLAVLTYHSVEDRMVKNFMKTGNILGDVSKDFFGKVETPWRLVTRQPVTASEQEILENPRARSAKLRVAELKD